MRVTWFERGDLGLNEQLGHAFELSSMACVDEDCPRQVEITGDQDCLNWIGPSLTWTFPTNNCGGIGQFTYGYVLAS